MRRVAVILGLTAVGTLATLGLAAAVVCLSSGCSTAAYYAQAVSGHLDIVQRAQPVAELLASAQTDAALRERLALSQQMRDFAVSELGLPDNASYRRYADLGRSAVVWNVVAAPELSLTLKTWCFAVVGCVGYRGYYRQEPAQALAQTLQSEGLEVRVYGVPAYSTLGWTNWLGGDPLLNTFLRWPEAQLAGLIFHELAHQVVYVNGDTAFNESFATAVERLGAERWLARRGAGAAWAEQELSAQRRRDFQQLTGRYRTLLQELYASQLPDPDKRLRKAELMSQLRSDHAQLKTQQWQGFAGYDAWFANANNASLAILGTYNDGVPAFLRLFEQQGRDFGRFYGSVKGLAALPKEQRQATLRALAPATPGTPNALPTE